MIVEVLFLGNVCRAYSAVASRIKATFDSMFVERSRSICCGYPPPVGVVLNLNHEPSKDISRLLSGPTASVSTGGPRPNVKLLRFVGFFPVSVWR